jgi:hypothetical protein
MRLSIEISLDQYRQLKAYAAFHGQSIEDYVLERSLTGLTEKSPLCELEDFLKPRLEAANNKEF